MRLDFVFGSQLRLGGDRGDPERQVSRSKKVIVIEQAYLISSNPALYRSGRCSPVVFHP